jgi:hypothetical protein
MSKFALRIGDEKGTSFRIRLELGLNKYLIGTWHALDFGAIKPHNGTTVGQDHQGHWFDQDLYICNSEGQWGIRLDHFEGFWGDRDDGTGELLQGFCASMQPGVVSWVFEQTT